MVKQLRKTSGMYLEHGDFSCVIDPGPGALVQSHEYGLAIDDLDAVIVSHAHLDHYGDMNAMIEAMTGGGKEGGGRVLCSASVQNGAEIPSKYVDGEGVYGKEVPPVLNSYYSDIVEDVVVMRDGDAVGLGPFDMRCIETEHSDPRTVAFTLEDEKQAGFVTDTELFDGLIDFFSGSDVLVMNVMRPHHRDWKGHLNTRDALEILTSVEPEFAILQHFGAALIYSSVKEEEEWLRERTDVDFVMAEDGMEIDLQQTQNGLDDFVP